MRKNLQFDFGEVKSYIDDTLHRALIPSEQLTPADWSERNFKHGANSESFDLERFPFLREPLDCISDYRIEEQLLICPPQVGKSLTAEAAICYFIVEDPADLVAYTHTIPLCKMWSEQRVMPSIRKCALIAPLLPNDPKKMRVLEILFPHMVIEVAPANLTQTQSRSRRIVICDERWLWESGRYDNARRRAASPNYDGRRKIISFSNSGDYESDVEIQWRESDQRVLFSNCPECGKEATYKFSEKKCRRVPAAVPGFSIKWEENVITRPNGIWNINEVVKTVRLVCPHCSVELEDTAKIRVKLRRAMHYKALNPTGSSRAWSVSGVAVYPWADLVKQFLNANQQLDLGDDKAMREFMLKGLNEPWSEDVIFDLTTNTTGDYDMTGEPWEKADFSAMTVDYQELAPYFWYVIRDWSESGPSRLRKCGFAHTWDQMREIQHDNNLPDRFVMVDCNYRGDEVFEHCAAWGWVALRGRPEDYFIHSRKMKNPVRRYYSEMRLVDPAIGTDRQGDGRRRRAIEFMWADSPVKDILARLFGGKGIYFGVPRDVPQFYMNHMSSERKTVVETRGNREIRRWMKVGKRPNHLWDCEAMQIAFALIKGPLRLAGDETPVEAPGEPAAS